MNLPGVGSPLLSLRVLSDVLRTRPTLSHVQSALDVHPTTQLQSGMEQRPRVGHGSLPTGSSPEKGSGCYHPVTLELPGSSGPSRCLVRSCQPWAIPVVYSKSCTPNAGSFHMPPPQGLRCFLHPITRESLC